MEAFDRFLSESGARPEWVIVHPRIWNGHWSIKPIPMWARKPAKFVGKFVNSRWLCWVGLPLYWVTGWKELYPHLEGELMTLEDFEN